MLLWCLLNRRVNRTLNPERKVELFSAWNNTVFSNWIELSFFYFTQTIQTIQFERFHNTTSMSTWQFFHPCLEIMMALLFSITVQKCLKNNPRNLRHICLDKLRTVNWDWNLWITRRRNTKNLQKESIHSDINMLSKKNCPEGKLVVTSRIYRGNSWRSWKTSKASLPLCLPSLESHFHHLKIWRREKKSVYSLDFWLMSKQTFHIHSLKYMEPVQRPLPVGSHFTFRYHGLPKWSWNHQHALNTTDLQLWVFN